MKLPEKGMFASSVVKSKHQGGAVPLQISWFGSTSLPSSYLKTFHFPSQTSSVFWDMFWVFPDLMIAWCALASHFFQTVLNFLWSKIPTLRIKCTEKMWTIWTKKLHGCWDSIYMRADTGTWWQVDFRGETPRSWIMRISFRQWLWTWEGFGKKRRTWNIWSAWRSRGRSFSANISWDPDSKTGRQIPKEWQLTLFGRGMHSTCFPFQKEIQRLDLAPVVNRGSKIWTCARYVWRMQLLGGGCINKYSQTWKSYLGFCKQDPNGTPATSVLAKVLATRISQWHIEPEHIQSIL